MQKEWPAQPNQRFNATSLSSDKIKKLLLLLLLCHLIVIPRLFFVVFPTAAFYLSALLSNDVVWSAKKYVETSHLSPRSSLYISSAAVASVQMARRFSSFFGCSPWFLAHILNLKSKIKTKKNRLIFTYGEQNLKSLSEIHISKKTITHFLLLIDGSEGAAIWLFPWCWIVQSSHAQSHQNEFHFNFKRLFFSICLKKALRWNRLKRVFRFIISYYLQVGSTLYIHYNHEEGAVGRRIKTDHVTLHY